MPFSRSRSVPGRLSRGSRTRLATHPPPCTETILSISRQVSVASCQRQPPAKSQRLRPRTIPYRIILLSTQHTSLNTYATVAGGPVPKDRPHPVRLATAARPETHQNLIYSNKDHAPGLDPADSPSKGAPTASPPLTEQIAETTCPGTIPATPNLLLLRDTSASAPAIGRPIPTTSTPFLVEVIGLEPTTPCLQSRCSPS
jgi:hypothetical protein